MTVWTFLFIQNNAVLKKTVRHGKIIYKQERNQTNE